MLLNFGAFSPATDDLREGWSRNRLWLTLARDDARMRYRRSLLGPLWLTLATGFFILVLSGLWIEILGKEARVFVPWVTIGLTTYQMISAIMIEGANVFTSVANIIHNIPMPLSVHVFRAVTKHLINYLHNFLIVITVLVIFPPPISLKILLFLPGLLIVTLTAVACSITLGMLGARYRDFSYSIAMLMGPMFFLTPILWEPSALTGNRAKLAELNPITHFIAIIREPLIGHAPALLNYAVAIGILLLLTVSALTLMSKHRAKVPYWIG